MNIETCRPLRLPLKKLDWERLAPWLGNARQELGRFDEELRSTPEARLILEPLIWEEVMASLRSQNRKTSFEELLLFTTTGASLEHQEPFLKKILYAKQAFTAALRWGPRRKLGTSFFCHLHGLLKQDAALEQDIGRIRTRQNWIGPQDCKREEAYFFPPAPSQVRPLLRNLSAYIQKQDTEPLVQTAIAFAQFLIIHPFMDGNGRVGRIFIPHYAARRGLLSQPALFLSRYFEDDRLEYFQQLFTITESSAWESWIIYFLRGVAREVKRGREKFRRLRALNESVKRVFLMKGKRLNKRLLEPLIEILEQD